MLEKITRGMLVIGMINFPFIKIINKNKINPPIAYLEKTKKREMNLHLELFLLSLVRMQKRRTTIRQ